MLSTPPTPVSPGLVQQPASVADLGEAVRQAGQAGLAVYPRGGQTHSDLGLPASRPGILLDTRLLNQVIDYPARDQTITVQAGMTIAALEAVLSAEKQRLPIDVPHAADATVGGCLAVNASGPRRYGWGTLRDYLIGFSAIGAEGQEFKAGGRVVKNVAGYDLCKLMIGSLGTLGVITQATFKLRPAAEDQALFAFPCMPAELGQALDLLHASKTRPVCLEVLNPASSQTISRQLGEPWPDQWAVVVGFECNTDTLQWQVQQLITEIAGRWVFRGALGCCSVAFWRALIEFGGWREGVLSFQASTLPSALAAFCTELEQILAPVQLSARAGNGIVVGHCLGEQPAGWPQRIGKARQLALARGGSLIVTRCPAEWKTPEFIWGPPRGDWELMRAVKKKLDPASLFNPGRFVV